MHISEQTLAALASRGWSVKGNRAEKLFRGLVTPGMLSNGDRVLTVAFSEDGRWLEHFHGFDVAFDMDSRDYIGRPDEFAAEIERRVTDGMTLERAAARPPHRVAVAGQDMEAGQLVTISADGRAYSIDSDLEQRERQALTDTAFPSPDVARGT